MPHVIGQPYTFAEIQAEYQADAGAPFYLVHKGSKIVALRLRRDTNPRIDENPGQVFVGAGRIISKWGKRLAVPGGKFPLYVKTGIGRGYYYRGVFKVSDRIYTREELIAAIAMPRVGRLSQIVFLEPLI